MPKEPFEKKRRRKKSQPPVDISLPKEITPQQPPVPPAEPPASESAAEHDHATQMREVMREAMSIFASTKTIPLEKEQTVLERCAALGLTSTHGDTSDPQAVRRALFDALCAAPRHINNVSSLFNEHEGKPFPLTEGRVVMEQQNKKLVTDWRKQFQDERPEYIAEVEETLLTELANLQRHHDPCNVFLRERGGIVVINIDAGRHKESVTVIPPQTNERDTIAVYRHTASAHERELPDKLRAQYISDAIRQHVFSIHSHTEPAGNFKAVTTSSGTGDLANLFRLALSVKDLDLYLKTHQQVDEAVWLFQKGVTNMIDVLSLASIEQNPKEFKAKKMTTITAPEKQLLVEMFTKRAEYRAYIDTVRTALEHASAVRDINYRALETVEQLRALGQGETAARPGEMRRVFERCVRSIHEMLNALNRASVPVYDCADTDIDNLAAQFADAIDMLDFSSTTDEPTSPQSQRALQDARDSIMDMIDDTPEQLESWEDVRSLNQAIRYLHRRLYTVSERFGRGIDNRLKYSHDPLLPRADRDSDVTLVDVRTGKTSSSLGAIATRLVSELHPSHPSIHTGERQKPILILGDGYLELRASAGKHLIELLAEQDPRELTVNFRLCESGYHGSSARLAFTRTMLQENDFVDHTSTEIQGRRLQWIQMHLKTESPERWKQGLQTTLRLVRALPDMDLLRVPPEFYDLFREGVTHISNLGTPFIRLRRQSREDLLATVKEDQQHQLRGAAGVIAHFGCAAEHRLLVEALLQKLRGPEDWKRICAAIPEDDREPIITTLLDMELEARRHKDTTAARQLKTRADAVINLSE